jgi:hypothetical protein
MSDFQAEKDIVLAYIKAFDAASENKLTETLQAHTSETYHWRGMHPFNEQTGPHAVISSFWGPLRHSFTRLQRRMDFFFAGTNDCEENSSVWVVNAGNFLGLFDHDWLGIPATRKIALLRYAEFHRVENGRIAETALFCDILSVMHQASAWPKALSTPMTGAPFIYPGPQTHDGLQMGPQDPAEARKTTALVHEMVADLSGLNTSGEDRCPPELLAKTWHEDMLWYGPYGIGASYTIPRYQEQHQYPFREGLSDKVFNGHIARISEGNYCGFFGWPNLNNKNTGGFLGLPKNDINAEMRVVDLYRRNGDKLAENWVFIDMLHYLKQQGVDVLGDLNK